jgi:hypothetical protein
MDFSPAKLFSAVVVAGAALTGCVGPAPKSATIANSHTPSSDGTKGKQPQARVDADGCPAGSEIPFPPCVLIL